MVSRTARLVARTIRGLESLCAQEISKRGHGRVERIRHREVVFATRCLTPDLLTLRTADDVFVLAAVVEGVDRRESSLTTLSAAVAHADLRGAADIAATLTKAKPSRQIDVSASFVGPRNYSRYEIEDVVGDAVARHLDVTYHSRASGGRPPPDTASWRVTIEDRTAIVGLRPARHPLHRRAWKRASVPGTLHPPVAAAMAVLARLRPGDQVLDPCCGAGTLLVEAADLRPGLMLTGSDSSPASLAAAAVNAAHLCDRTTIRWMLADAGRLPLGISSVDRILVNPPWQRQVAAQHSLGGGMGNLWDEAARVLRPGGLVVGLLDSADAFPHTRAGRGDWCTTRRIPISLFGRHPDIVVAERQGRPRKRY